MNLHISGAYNAIHIKRQGILAHIPCHSATVTVRQPLKPDIDILAIFTPSPFPCWIVGAKNDKATKAEACSNSPEYSVEIEDAAAVVVTTEDGDRMEIF